MGTHTYCSGLALFLFFLILACSSVLGQNSSARTSYIKNSTTPLGFVENKGQFKSDILFLGRSGAMEILLKKEGVTYVQIGEKDVQLIEIQWPNTSKNCSVRGKEKLLGRNNYYSPSNKEGIKNVEVFKTIEYQNIYPGIDLIWYYKNGEPGFDFIVSSHSNYRKIKWKVNSDNEPYVDKNGRLTIESSAGKIIHDFPCIYQNEAEISGKWNVKGSWANFKIKEYEKSQVLVIDPIVRNWGTYYGGLGDDIVHDCQVDDSSNIICVGETRSTTLISSSGAHQTMLGGNNDAFIIKFNSNGDRIWSTYLGGAKNDVAYGLALDSHSIYVTGAIESDSLFSSIWTHQPYKNSSVDGFLIRMTHTGTILWGTYLGGANIDRGYSCVMDKNSNVYVCGSSNSYNGMATSSSYQTLNAGDYDGFINKFSSAGIRLYGSYYGGSADDSIVSCAVDTANNLYLAGTSTSSSGIATSNGFYNSLSGSVSAADAFLVKFDHLNNRQWGTYYGGSLGESGSDCVVDMDMNIYLAGSTGSSSQISTFGSHQFLNAGGDDAYLVKFDRHGQRIWATYVGTQGLESGKGLIVDDSNNIYLTGASLPGFGSLGQFCSSDAYQNVVGGGYDAFYQKFDSSGLRKSGSLYGGPGFDFANTICVGKQGDVFLGGYTKSSAAMASSNAYQTIYNGGIDAFLVRFNSCQTDSIYVSDSVCHEYLSPSGKYVWNRSGVYKDTLVNQKGCDSLITLNLTITSIDNSVLISGDSLIALEMGSNYQWLNCDKGNTPIMGALSRIFSPYENGNYAVIIEKKNCIDTSECISLNTIGLVSNDIMSVPIISPNPFEDVLWVCFPSHLFQPYLEVFKLDGVFVESFILDGECGEINVSWPDGVYILRFFSKDGKSGHVKLLKE